MDKKHSFTLIVFLVLQLLFATGINNLAAKGLQSVKARKSDFVDNEILVKYRTGVSNNAEKAVENYAGTQRIELIGFLDIARLKVPKGQVLAKVREFNNRPEVLYAEPNFIKRTSVLPNDPNFKKQWGLHNTGQNINGIPGVADADIDAPQSWSKSKGSSGIIIAVVDTGIQWSHPDLQSNIWVNQLEIPDNGIDDDLNGFIDDTRGWDFYSNDNTIYDNADDDYHGTHVAGIIGAGTNNSLGVSGVNWSVKIMPVKFLGDGGFGTVADEVKALNYAANNGAKIINASYGSFDHSITEFQAVSALKKKGVLFVAAAGNWQDNNDASPSFPASYGLSNIISVGASNNEDNRAYFTNTGANSVHIFAPGEDILSTYPSGKYAYLSGTSMAAPFVTGSAGLISAYYGLSYSGIKSLLLQAKDSKSTFNKYALTGGRLNLYDSLINKKPALTSPIAGGSLKRGTYNRIRWNRNGVEHLAYMLWAEKRVRAKSLEDFESKIPVGASFQGFARWSRTSKVKFKGSYSFASGPIGHSKSSSFALRRYIPEDSYISFTYKVSSEPESVYWYGDSLSFQIDGMTSFRVSGKTGWLTKKILVKKGWHTFKWVYAKDYSVSNGADKAWVDNIRFTARPSRIRSVKIAQTAKGASSYNWKVPTNLATGNYNVCVTGISGTKKTSSSKISIKIIR